MATELKLFALSMAAHVVCCARVIAIGSEELWPFVSHSDGRNHTRSLVCVPLEIILWGLLYVCFSPFNSTGSWRIGGVWEGMILKLCRVSESWCVTFLVD